MTAYNKHPVLAGVQNAYFKYTPEMYPYEFMGYYKNLKIYLPEGQSTFHKVEKYMSKYSGDRKTACNAFLRNARKHYADQPGSPPYDFLQNSVGRIVSCFAGHGLPEEISVICSMAVISGHKSAGQIQYWAAENFGLDCNGFVNAYYTSLGTFQKPLYYIPSYKNRGGVAKSAQDITYDNAVLWARKKPSGDWEVRPNPGNGAHIAVIDCWSGYGSTLWVSQMASSTGLTCHQYDVVDPPKSTKNGKVRWRIQRRGGNKVHNVILTQRMPVTVNAE